MRAKDFKKQAKESLKGNWFSAIIAAIIASSFGAIGSNITFNLENLLPGTENAPGDEGVTAFASAIGQQGTDDMFSYMLLVYGVVLGFAVLSFLVTVLISSFVRVGYAQFNLDLIDSSSANVGTLFSRIGQFGVAFRTYILMYFRVFLGSLLIIPGIVMSFSYAMFEYVMADNPDMTPKEVLAESRRIMRGNRWKLFCLSLSFFGPALLCILTLGIGFIWYLPYLNATLAAFYREAKRTA